MWRDLRDTARAMSRENVEIVQRTLEAFEQRGLEATLPFYDPEVTWEEAEDEPDGETYQGHDGLRALAAKWLVPFDDLRIEPEEFIDAGDRVVVLQREYQRSKSGAELVIDTATILDLRDRRIVRIQGYMNPAEALAAAGLSEQDAHADSS